MITASLNHNTNSTRGTYIENALALIQGVQNCKTRRLIILECLVVMFLKEISTPERT